jgi:GTP-binding protein
LQFVDEASFVVRGGRGGDGSVSFNREKYKPRGGPDGGRGGDGGSVLLRATEDLSTLEPHAYRNVVKAGRGGHGSGNNRAGERGKDAALEVPVGTQVFDADGLLADLSEPEETFVVAEGGEGGRGNGSFATSTRRAPAFRERGLPGEEREIRLELKVLSDVGLVGLPNAGKSSLLGRLTRAAPKVGDYPFTTLEPVLGTLDAEDRQLVLADIPGLIEGASGGAGLGHEFLAHVERTRLLVHVLDLAPLDGSDPEQNFATIEAELAAYDERLASLPRILALNKADLVPAEEAERAARQWRARLGDAPVLITSAATGHGLEDLKTELLRRVPVDAPTAQDVIDLEPLAEHRVFRPGGDRGFTVQRTGERAFRVSGPRVERLLQRFDVENEEAAAHVEHRLDRIGVIQALENEGFQPGDEVEIAGQTFELDPAS